MKCKKCGQELEIGVKFCPNCGEDCVSQDTGIPVKSLLIKQKVQLMILGKNMQKKKLKFLKKFNMLEVLTFGSGILAIISCFFTICFSIDFFAKIPDPNVRPRAC